jgi:AcrR family transcriptional regulator
MVRVMLRVGPAELTLGAIAAEAGVTAGALVQRFGSKQNDLADPVLRRHLLRLWRAARARYEQLPADAVVASELRADTDVRALARMIEVTLGARTSGCSLSTAAPRSV